MSWDIQPVTKGEISEWGAFQILTILHQFTKPLMPLRFKIKKTFTSPLPAAEATASLQELLNARSKLIFFTFATNFGSISGNEFTLRIHKGDRFGIFSPRIEGSIHSENPTIVNTQVVIPYLIIGFYLVFRSPAFQSFSLRTR